MSWYMGIDIGSGTAKGVITHDGQLEAFHLVPSGVNYRLAAANLREHLLSQLNLRTEDIRSVGATGHGAGNIPFPFLKCADLLSCARGISRIFPSVRTVIDIQGQSSQAIRISQTGQVVNFAINEKCASGSGRFLDIIANVLQVELQDIGDIASKSNHPVAFTTGCAVFGESEAVSRVAEGTPREDILAGVLQSLADRISALVEKVGMEERCAVSGGGALSSGLVRKIADKLEVQLLVPSQPQIINALGAAIIAEETEVAKCREY